MPLAGELPQLLDDDGRAGMLIPSDERLGGEHHLDQARGEARLDRLLERRAPCRRGARPRPASSPRREAVVAEHARSSSSRPLAVRSAIARMPARSSPVVSRTPGVAGTRGGVVARRAAEDEVDRRAASLARRAARPPPRGAGRVQAARGRPPLAGARPGRRAAPRRAGCLRVGPARRCSVGSSMRGARPCGRRPGRGSRARPAARPRSPPRSGRGRS